jgi:hypothetical protein
MRVHKDSAILDVFRLLGERFLGIDIVGLLELDGDVGVFGAGVGFYA